MYSFLTFAGCGCYVSSVSFLPVQVGSSCHLQHLCLGQHPLLCPFQPPILCIPLHIHFLHQCLPLLFHPLLQQPVLWAFHQLPTLIHFQQSPSSSQVSNSQMYIIIQVCIILAVMAHMHPDLGNLCLALNNCSSFSCLVSLFSIGLDVQIPPLACHVVPTISRDFLQLKELKILQLFVSKFWWHGGISIIQKASLFFPGHERNWPCPYIYKSSA